MEYLPILYIITLYMPDTNLKHKKLAFVTTESSSKLDKIVQANGEKRKTRFEWYKRTPNRFDLAFQPKVASRAAMVSSKSA